MQIITKDTTWAAGQVINLTEDVQVAPGVTLTIDPGAQVQGGGHSIQAFGTLKAIGEVGSEIYFSNTRFVLGNGNIFIDRAQIDGGGFGYSGSSNNRNQLTNSLISNETSHYFDIYYMANSDTISNNIFLNAATVWLGGLSSSGVTKFDHNIFDFYSTRTAILDGGVYNSALQTSSSNAYLNAGKPSLTLTDYGKLTSDGDYFGGATPAQLVGMIVDRNDSLYIDNYVNLQNVRSTPSSSLPTEMFTFTSIDMPSDIVKTARIVGGADVKLKGNKLDNIITVNSGNNTIDGGSGVDTVVVHGSSAQYQFSVQNGSAVIKDTIFSRDGTNTLTNIEHIQFTDGTIAADLAVTPDNALIYRLYQAAFARMPDEGGLRYWVGKHDKGLSVNDMAPLFRGSQEFIQKYGTNLTNAQYVDQLYLNVLGRKGETGGVTYWNDVLDSGKATKDTVLIGFAGSPENVSGTAAHIDHGFFIG